jgi:trans-aconitate methyltransferase
MQLRQIFNTNAYNYEKYRPKYSMDITKTIMKYKNLEYESNILEIGCGTGQATELFIGLESKIHCIDIGNKLIQIARSKYSKNQNIDFEVIEYEKYKSNIKFDLIFSATAYHWIKQPIGDIKTKSLLKDDGIFAIFRNIPLNQEEGFFLDSQPIYTKYMKKKNNPNDVKQLLNTDIFKVLNRSERIWEEEYYVEDYINLLSTYSDHIKLKNKERKNLYSDLRKLINGKYNGKVLKKYKEILEIGKINTTGYSFFHVRTGPPAVGAHLVKYAFSTAANRPTNASAQ